LDPYDVLLREFFSQFDLIARANYWSNATKIVVLASNLKVKSRVRMCLGYRAFRVRGIKIKLKFQRKPISAIVEKSGMVAIT